MVYDDEVHFDSPIYSTGLDSAGFFDIPNIPLNPNVRMCQYWGSNKNI